PFISIRRITGCWIDSGSGNQCAGHMRVNRRAHRGVAVGSLIEAIITELSRFVVSMISTFGYTGIFITMAIESACIPLPSEIIMPFSGYLVTTGQFTMLGVTLAGAIGNVAGSLVAYYVGVWG